MVLLWTMQIFLNNKSMRLFMLCITYEFWYKELISVKLSEAH